MLFCELNRASQRCNSSRTMSSLVKSGYRGDVLDHHPVPPATLYQHSIETLGDNPAVYQKSQRQVNHQQGRCYCTKNLQRLAVAQRFVGQVMTTECHQPLKVDVSSHGSIIVTTFQYRPYRQVLDDVPGRALAV